MREIDRIASHRIASHLISSHISHLGESLAQRAEIPDRRPRP
jgi:hypothetical protein